MITSMNHVTLAVKDIDKSFRFYRDILELKPLCRWDKGAYFLAGDFWFCLNVDEMRQPNPCYTHYAFSVSVTEFDTMSQRIISSGAVVFKDNTSPGASLYFLDPDQHKLEIHVSNWQERIAAKKINPGAWKNIEWFE
ncbi:MAG: VOC family protein [Proteobacteria bacterium]|nr:VOC family protein [Pseudomonadota bacterium]